MDCCGYYQSKGDDQRKNQVDILNKKADGYQDNCHHDWLCDKEDVSMGQLPVRLMGSCCAEDIECQDDERKEDQG